LIDLEDLTRQYPPPNEIRVMKVSMSSDLIVTALLADDFHQLTNATEVHGIAQLIVTRMSGILFARDAERSITRLGSLPRSSMRGVALPPERRASVPMPKCSLPMEAYKPPLRRKSLNG